MVRNLLILTLLAGYVSAITTSGEITADETWTDDVTVTGDVIVSNGTLTIGPGVTVALDDANDNIVYGDSARICIAVKDNGRLKINGNEDNRVVLRQVDDYSGSTGRWYGLKIIESPDTARITCCDLERCGYGVDATAVDSTPGGNTIVMNGCSVYKTDRPAVAVENGTDLLMDGCVLNDCYGTYGIWAHGAGKIDVSNTYILNCWLGAVLSGDTLTKTKASFDHLTFFNIDGSYQPGGKWFGGYGIYTAGEPCSLYVSNSIFYDYSLGAISLLSWSMQEKNNCFYSELSLMPLIDGEVDATSLEADPEFYSDHLQDLRIYDSSPCWRAASDGTNIGAWQEGDAWLWAKTGMAQPVPFFKEQNAGANRWYDILGRRINRTGQALGVYFSGNGMKTITLPK